MNRRQSFRVVVRFSVIYITVRDGSVLIYVQYIMSISCLKVFDKVCYFLTGNLPVNNVIYSLQKLNISSLDGLTSHSERKPPASSHSKTVNYILAIELFFFH